MLDLTPQRWLKIVLTAPDVALKALHA